MITAFFKRTGGASLRTPAPAPRRVQLLRVCRLGPALGAANTPVAPCVPPRRHATTDAAASESRKRSRPATDEAEGASGGGAVGGASAAAPAPAEPAADEECASPEPIVVEGQPDWVRLDASWARALEPELRSGWFAELVRFVDGERRKGAV